MGGGSPCSTPTEVGQRVLLWERWRGAGADSPKGARDGDAVVCLEIVPVEHRSPARLFPQRRTSGQ